MKNNTFDLSEYTWISDKEKKYINHYFHKERIDSHGHRLFEGFVTDAMMWEFCRKIALKSGHLYYNGYFYSQEKQIILTFAEGDIYLKLFHAKSEYDLALNEVITFFKEK